MQQRLAILEAPTNSPSSYSVTAPSILSEANDVTCMDEGEDFDVDLDFDPIFKGGKLK